MPVPPVHIAKSHGAMPMHWSVHAAPSKHVTSLQSFESRQSIVHSASGPVHDASHSELLRQSIAHSASVQVTSQVLAF